MSIKRKKHITQSMNHYRWRTVEEHLMLMGYICKDMSKDLRVWVDCASNGRDIQYTCYNLLNTEARFRGSPKAQYIDPVFDVMCTHSVSGNQVYASHHTLGGAIKASRDNPRW